jgi:release factor glutamine methyltransferase
LEQLFGFNPGGSVMAESCIRSALLAAETKFGSVHDTARLDAEVLLSHVLNCPRQRLYAWPESTIEADQLELFRQLVDRRVAGEPVAYLTGRREFWSLDLEVNPDTLIPRPDTERLVEVALAVVPDDAPWRIADLGTGCGALALALAKERPGCHVIATDIKLEALNVARRNAGRLEIANVEFRVGDWCEALANTPCELIVSNPPYVPESDPHLEQGDVRFEPREALVGGADGLLTLRHIAETARHDLTDGGYLMLEHGFDQGERLRDFLRGLRYHRITSHRDYGDQERVTAAAWPGCSVP